MLRVTTLTGSVALALAVAAPAAAVTFVSGGLGAACYEHARANTNTMEAIGQCTQALTQSGLSRRERAATHVNRGIIYLRRGHFDSAMSDFDRAEALEPTLAESYINRGTAFLRQENYSAAIEALTEGLGYDPEDPAQAYYNRAVAYDEMGNYRAAYNDYTRAAELAPTWNAPRVELTRFQVR